MRQKSGRLGQTMRTRGSGDEEGRTLDNTARGVKLGFLTIPAAGTGQVPKDMSAHTDNKGLTGEACNKNHKPVIEITNHMDMESLLI